MNPRSCVELSLAFRWRFSVQYLHACLIKCQQRIRNHVQESYSRVRRCGKPPRSPFDKPNKCPYFFRRASSRYRLPGKNPDVQNAESLYMYSAPPGSVYSGNNVGGEGCRRPLAATPHIFASVEGVYKFESSSLSSRIPPQMPLQYLLQPDIVCAHVRG
jgi:hypothetical protein